MAKSKIQKQFTHSDVIQDTSTNITSDNVDSFTETGIFGVWITSGAPWTGRWGVMIVDHSYVQIKQILFTSGGIAYRERNYQTNQWINWKIVSFS